jgi:hypothetical protein
LGVVVHQSLNFPPEKAAQVQQLLAELVTVMTMWEQTKVVTDCEMQVAQGTHELGFDEGNHIQYHTPSYKRIDVMPYLLN